ncbi:MAG: hypothetical protein M9921_04180 [Fimbriimonadaceae bacterium]|nr:hypothetical protein [Chthonomonadaceae bacterium]MCO5296033.1 hypothetical protein [Fimbriimonadaceae bacterium]
MIRWLMVAGLAAMTMAASAQDCCEKKVVAQTAPKACCTKDQGKIVAQVKQDKECCASPKADDREAAFMAEAHRMMAAAEMKAKGTEECCQSTAEKPMAKGDPGCCNAPGAPAKFKVFVAGQGYKFFGCEDSAGQGRSALLAEGKVVGKVQKVTSNAKI